MDLQSLSVGLLSTSYDPCNSNSNRCHPLKAFSPRQHLSSSCISMSLDRTRRTNSCRQLCLHRNWVQMFKCRSAAESYPNAPIDVEAAEVVGDEDDDYPLWMEEDDPNWPEDDPSGEGVGFQMDQFFQPKIMNVPNKDGSTDNDDGDPIDVNWDAEQYQWIVKEISSVEWDIVARDDPTPLIFFAFERYGPSGAECWKLLEELEKVVRIIVESRRYPIRAVKLDISSEPAVGDALKIMTLPCLLFINGGKHIYRLYGTKPADELLAITSHLFYHSSRPACMDEADTSHKGLSFDKRQTRPNLVHWQQGDFGLGPKVWLHGTVVGGEKPILHLFGGFGQRLAYEDYIAEEENELGR